MTDPKEQFLARNTFRCEPMHALISAAQYAAARSTRKQPITPRRPAMTDKQKNKVGEIARHIGGPHPCDNGVSYDEPQCGRCNTSRAVVVYSVHVEPLECELQRLQAENALMQSMIAALARKVANLTRRWAKAGNVDNSAEYWTSWARHDAEAAYIATEDHHDQLP